MSDELLRALDNEVRMDFLPLGTRQICVEAAARIRALTGEVMNLRNIVELDEPIIERLQSDLAAARADALMSEIERAARDLPNGFSIQIAVENGSAWVELHNADCEEVDFCRDDRTLTEQVTEAIDAALSPTVSEGAGEAT